MSQLFAQQSLGTDIWATLGSPDAAAATLHADLLVTYSDGSTDTIPAGTSTTNVDTTADVYIVTSVHGSLTLDATKESLLSGLTGDWVGLVRLWAGQIFPYVPGLAGPPGATGGTSGSGLTAAINVIWDGGGATIPTDIGVPPVVTVPYGCTITSALLLADAAATVEVDITKTDYATYPSTTSIVASAPPTLIAAQKSSDSTLTGWTTALAAGSILEFTLSANDVALTLTCTLLITRT